MISLASIQCGRENEVVFLICGSLAFRAFARQRNAIAGAFTIFENRTAAAKSSGSVSLNLAAFLVLP